MAQIIRHYLPHKHKSLIEVHNYIETSSLKKKQDNWNLLNKKVFSKFNRFQLSKAEMNAVIECQAGVIEKVLFKVKHTLQECNLKKAD